jgi:hypothetical protein
MNNFGMLVVCLKFNEAPSHLTPKKSFKLKNKSPHLGTTPKTIRAILSHMWVV